MNTTPSYQRLRKYVLSASTSKEKGDRFEQATEMWLYEAPEFNDESRHVSQVSRWESFARTWNRGRDEESVALDAQDLGIDLVARMSDGTFVPVQCKGDAGNSERAGALKFSDAIRRAEESGVSFGRGVYASRKASRSAGSTPPTRTTRQASIDRP